MLRQIIGCLLLVIILAIAAQAQSNYWYYNNDGSRLNFQVFDNLVAVRVDPGLPGFNAANFAIENPCLVDTFTAQPAPGDFYVFGVEPGYDLDSAIGQLLTRPDVRMVNPVVMDEYGDRAKLDNSLSVIYNDGVSQSEIEALQQSFGLTVKEVLDDSAFQIYFLDCNQRRTDDICALARAYYETGLCYAVEPNLTMKAVFNSNDAYFGEQWTLKNIGQNGGTAGVDIDWELGNQYANASFTPPVVALLDGGFEMDHEDLPPNWYWHPYNAAGYDIDIPYIPNYDPSNECGDDRTHCWHGTTTLGVVEAATGNGIGLAGAESRAKVMPVKVADAYGWTSRECYERALNWTAKQPGAAQIITMTMSLPIGWSAVLDPMMRTRYLNGVPIICAAGNGGAVGYPANSRYALAVGQTNNNDDVMSSSTGAALDLVAPGHGIWTLDLMGSEGLNPGHSGLSCNSDQNYACRMTGTSFAAPLVAGIAAKLLLRDPWLMGSHYNDSAEVMYDILRRSCERQHYGVNNEDYRRVNDMVGWGRVNEARAISEACKRCGDANDDRSYDIGDAVYIIAHIFTGGAAPLDCRYSKGMGDANGDQALDISDAVYLISRIFTGGAAPHCFGM